MTKRRINPETGMLEEDSLFGWAPVRDESGSTQRINPKTGVSETDSLLGWTATRDGQGNTERVNPETGVRETDSLLGWTAARDERGGTERINPVTGVYETDSLLGWTPKRDGNGRRMRINPHTGEHETESLFGWTAQDSNEQEGRARGRRRELSSDPIELTLQLIWMMFVVTIGFIYAIIRYRHARAAYFVAVSAVLQLALFVSVQQGQPGAAGMAFGAVCAASVGVLLYRSCFSLLRLGGPQEGRINAWTVSGALAVASSIGIVVVVLADPTIAQPRRLQNVTAPQAEIAVAPAQPVGIQLSASRVAAMVDLIEPTADVREFESGSPVGYSVEYANANNDTIHVMINSSGLVSAQCVPYVLNGSGRYNCQFPSLQDGQYAFRIDVNGTTVEELPFVVVAKEALGAPLENSNALADDIESSAPAVSDQYGVSGEWSGGYWRDGRRPTAVALIISADGESLSGKGSEPRLFGRLYLSMSGSIAQDRTVSFAMRADGGYVVQYDGVLSEDGTAITGHWQRGEGSGDFRLERKADGE